MLQREVGARFVDVVPTDINMDMSMKGYDWGIILKRNMMGKPGLVVFIFYFLPRSII